MTEGVDASRANDAPWEFAPSGIIGISEFAVVALGVCLVPCSVGQAKGLALA